MFLVKHSGFISSIKYNSLTPWYTTQTDNEIITFQETTGDKRLLNSFLVEAENTDLYIRMLPSDYCLFVPANSYKEFNYEDMRQIQVMNVAGTKLRWSGQFY